MKFARMSAVEAANLSPLDIEIEPGFPIRNLETVEACDGILMKLDMEIGSIINQIGMSEADPKAFEKGWRTKAQNALRWKRRVTSAIHARRETLRKETPPARSGDAAESRRALIIAVIQEDIGDEAMERYARIARHRYPEAWPPVTADAEGF